MRVSRRGLLVGAGLVGGGVALVALSSSSTSSTSSASVPSVANLPTSAPGPWVDPDAPRRIRQLAANLEQAAGWPGLGDYLAGIAWIESRGNAHAGSDVGNAARGWFGVRPQSAKVGELGLSPSALKDEADAVALAAWYAHRLRKYAAPGQQIDWLAVRRGWAYPGKVDDVHDPGYREQLAKGLAAAGVPADFMLRPAFPEGYEWPGIEAALQLTRGAIA